MRNLSMQLSRIMVAFAVLATWPAHAFAQSFETSAAQAFMVDVETGTVLFSKEPDAAFAPASLAKLMTMEVVFHAIGEGKLSLDDTFAVSENAWRTGGAPSGTSTMFAALKSSVAVRDLVRGVVVQQANDGCIVLAEGLAGSESAFAEMMNERARALGLTGSHFVNATGLPAEGQKTTVRDLVTLSTHLRQAHPDLFAIYAEPSFEWNKIYQLNRNPLLKLDLGADGLATGWSKEGGFAIAGSASRDGRRLLLAMSGLASDSQRADEARRMLEWGNKAFQRQEIFRDGELVGLAQTYGGAKGGVALKARGPISILVPVDNRERLIARIVYEGPLEAPVEAGVQVGKLKVWVGESLRQETPLYTAEQVPVGGLHRRALDAIEELLIGWTRG